MNRMLFLLTLTVISSLHLRDACSTEPIVIAQQRELFVDDHLVQATDGITFQLHQAETGFTSSDGLNP